jgi:predicted ATPase
MLQYPAVQLFAAHAFTSADLCRLTDDDAAAVAELCRRLDGLPLAIELAAVRLQFFGLRGLADRLDDRFSILTHGRRTAAPRHKTLEATLDWSYDILTDDEKRVLCRLAAFSGVFTIGAAEVVGIDRQTERFSIVDVLGNLVEKSLVAVDAQAGETRYRLLESLRLYAFRKLLETRG